MMYSQQAAGVAYPQDQGNISELISNTHMALYSSIMMKPRAAKGSPQNKQTCHLEHHVTLLGTDAFIQHMHVVQVTSLWIT